MHPYKSQVDTVWELIKLKLRAQKNEFWLEAISLSYILIEIELRRLLTTTAGESKEPIEPGIIDKQKYLMNLASLAKENGFIDNETFEKIKNFNSVRRDAIHKLAHGAIKYSDIKEPTLNAIKLTHEIQSTWLTITIGPQETCE